MHDEHFGDEFEDHSEDRDQEVASGAAIGDDLRHP
jgi:hypothetical protein